MVIEGFFFFESLFIALGSVAPWWTVHALCYEVGILVLNVYGICSRSRNGGAGDVRKISKVANWGLEIKYCKNRRRSEIGR